MASKEEKKMIFGVALSIKIDEPKWSDSSILQEAIIKCGGINSHIFADDLVPEFREYCMSKVLETSARLKQECAAKDKEIADLKERLSQPSPVFSSVEDEKIENSMGWPFVKTKDGRWYYCYKDIKGLNQHSKVFPTAEECFHDYTTLCMIKEGSEEHEVWQASQPVSTPTHSTYL